LGRVCDYVVILRSGKVQACGPVETVISTWAAGSTVPRRGGLSELEEAVLSYLTDGTATQ
jgi:ABC-type molybdate transport system ATPase subunit